MQDQTRLLLRTVYHFVFFGKVIIELVHIKRSNQDDDHYLRKMWE